MFGKFSWDIQPVKLSRSKPPYHTGMILANKQKQFSELTLVSVFCFLFFHDLRLVYKLCTQKKKIYFGEKNVQILIVEQQVKAFVLVQNQVQTGESKTG